MKAVILCGGKGTRMREETEYRPKPLVPIGGKPILWHIMKIYSQYGINDFILCTGYKSEMIKQYFMEMHWRNNDFTLHINGDKKIKFHTVENEDWNVTIVDTGLDTGTGARLRKIEKYLEDDEFFMTYGDGVSDINISELLEYHRNKGKIATITGVHPMSPFGLIEVECGIVKSFIEKPRLNDMINGGFMILNKEVFKYISDDEGCMFEEKPIKDLAYSSQLAVYEHTGFWTAIDTFKDIENINKMWNTGDRPWKIWR